MITEELKKNKNSFNINAYKLLLNKELLFIFKKEKKLEDDIEMFASRITGC